jgi:hypothetical protein
MRQELKAPLITAILILGIAVLFRTVLGKPSEVVPLFLVPAFLYVGYLIAPAGFKAWVILTLAVSVALAALYATPWS